MALKNGDKLTKALQFSFKILTPKQHFSELEVYILSTSSLNKDCCFFVKMFKKAIVKKFASFCAYFTNTLDK